MNISDLISKLDADWESLFDRVIESANLDEKEKETLSIARKIVSSIQNQKIETKNSAIARALGIIPSSETVGRTPRKKRKRRTPEERALYHRERRNFHDRGLRKSCKIAKKLLEKQQRKLSAKQKKEALLKKDDPIEVDDFEDDFDETAQAEKTEQECKDLEKALTENSGDADEFPSNDFTILNEPNIVPIEESIFIPAKKDEKDGTWRSAIVETERYDLDISIKKIICQKQILTDSITGEHRCGDIEKIGPKGSQFTWMAIANIILLIGGSAIPMHRAERLFGGGRFRRPNMVRMLSEFAWKFLPVYLDFAKALAQASILNGDDTGTRVNEVTRWKSQCEAAKIRIPEKTESTPKPWENRQEKWRKKNVPSLAKELQEKFGFEFPMAAVKKDGSVPKLKGAFQTTLITGRANQKDPLSQIAFYRTHFGALGNLLEVILKLRDFGKAGNTIIIQGDLSPANTVFNPPPGLKITYAGCSAHARRFFKRFYHHDPDFCAGMLSCFAMIAECEGYLDEEGRNSANVLAVRKKIAINYWQEAKSLAQTGLNVWSKETAIGKGLRYFLKGYEKLTVYLNEPHMAPDNNLSENLLRYENLEDNSSFGRATVEGRARYDIARSALATCGLASVEPRVFITFIMMADKDAIKAHPAYYHPRALRTWLESSEANEPPSDTAELKAFETAVRAQHTILKSNQ